MRKLSILAVLAAALLAAPAAWGQNQAITEDITGDKEINGVAWIGASKNATPAERYPLIKLSAGKTLTVNGEYLNIGHETLRLPDGFPNNMEPGIDPCVDLEFACLRVGEKNGVAANIKVGNALHIQTNGILDVEGNLNIDFTGLSGSGLFDGGAFILGRWDGEPNNVFDGKAPGADHADQIGGVLIMDEGVKVEIGFNTNTNIPVIGYFGNGGWADFDDGSQLSLKGDAYFQNGFSIRLNEKGKGQNLQTAHFDITGNVYIKEGVGFVNALPNNVDITGKSIIKATNGTIEAPDYVFSSLFYNFENSGEIVSVEGTVNSAERIVQMLNEMNVNVSANYAATAELVNSIRNNPDTDPVLVGRLEAYGSQMVSFFHSGNFGAAEIALRQLTGEANTQTMNAVADTMAAKQGKLNSRMEGNRSKSKVAQAQAPAAGYGEAENRVWAGGFGTWNTQKDRDSVLGYDYNAGGLLLGYEREVGNGLTLGVNGSWSAGTLKNNDGLSETDIKTFGLGLYGSYEFGNGFFIDGNLGYGRADNEADINLIIGGSKKSDFNSDSFTAGLNFGYALQLAEATYLTPSLGLQYTHIKQDSWQEKIVSDPNNAAVAHWFGDSKQDFLEIPLGLKLETNIETGDGTLITPELRVGGIIAANKPKSELRMGFVGSDESMTIHGVDPGQSRFTAGAGLKVQLNDKVDIFASYDLEAKSKYMGHQATAGLGFSF